MRYFLYTAFIGYFSWIGSEVAELWANGYTPLVFVLTAIYHLLAGIGIWGLHAAQMRGADKLSAIGTVLISLSFLVLVYFPIGAMQAGLTPQDYAFANPLFQLVGTINIAGFILFGVAIYRAGVFSKWVGPVIAIGNILFAVLLATGGGKLLNFVSIGLAMIILWMIKFALSQEHAPAE
ncbi:MAG: hypothetical protein AAF251_03745 [Pseudomonadota bacterium]